MIPLQAQVGTVAGELTNALSNEQKKTVTELMEWLRNEMTLDDNDTQISHLHTAFQEMLWTHPWIAREKFPICECMWVIVYWIISVIECIDSVAHLCDLFNCILTFGYFPESWTHGVFYRERVHMWC